MSERSVAFRPCPLLAIDATTVAPLEPNHPAGAAGAPLIGPMPGRTPWLPLSFVGQRDDPPALLAGAAQARLPEDELRDTFGNQRRRGGPA